VSYEDIPRDPSRAPPLPAGRQGPLDLLARWLDDARESAGMRNPLAMNVASVDEQGRPAARLVLCRGFDAEQGFLVFYTNYASRKGREIDARPRVAATFYWDALARQARIEGPVVRSPAAESDAYFASRPRASQISAWASAQSEPIASREALLERLSETERRFEGAPVPRPPHWGGYRIHADRIELWVGSDGRAHDRVRWTRTLEAASASLRAGEWHVERLQP
jgi:pyridoxamine 5'-phosphate oxidase